MGYGTWSDDTQRALNSQRQHQTINQTFANTAKKTISSKMSPDKLIIRESRDSIEHPDSIGVIVCLDETGSMYHIPVNMVKNYLPDLMKIMIKHNLPDVQVMFNGIGDHKSDRFPLQVGQFESDTTKLNEWLTEINLEGDGGGNNGESYLLSWFLAARYTSMDCFEKRGIKGVLFTIGDEHCHQDININQIRESETLKSMLNAAEVKSFTAKEILAECERTFHVYHIIVNHGNGKDYNGNDNDIVRSWKKLLGERVIILEDESNIAEVIAATVAMLHGADLDSITADFDSKTTSVVTTALANVTTSISKTGTKDGVIVL